MQITTKNPYNFVRMEKWIDISNIFNGYVGYCDNGDIYLTWDERDNVPVFSGSDKIGENRNVTMNDFERFRELYTTIKGKSIVSIMYVTYTIIGVKGSFEFTPARKVNDPIKTINVHKGFLSYILSFI